MKVSVSILDHNAWLAKAQSDLTAIRLCLKANEALDVAVYHAQQAAEKSFKGFIVFHNKQVKKTHDLVNLVEQCIKIDYAFIQLTEYAFDLNGYATYARYPDDFFIIDHAEATTAYEKAQFIVTFITGRLPHKNYVKTT